MKWSAYPVLSQLVRNGSRKGTVEINLGTRLRIGRVAEVEV